MKRFRELNKVEQARAIQTSLQEVKRLTKEGIIEWEKEPTQDNLLAWAMLGAEMAWYPNQSDKVFYNVVGNKLD